MTFTTYINQLSERASNYREIANLLEQGYLPLTDKVSKLLGGESITKALHLTSLYRECRTIINK